MMYRVDLWITNNCLDVNGTAIPVYYSNFISVTCTLTDVTAANFQFGAPYVSTWAATPQLFWGFGPTSGITSNFVNSNFANTPAIATNQYYYRYQTLLQTSTPTAVGAPVACIIGGPYCGPDPSAAATAGATMPTILFAGSVEHNTAATGGLANDVNYYMSPTLSQLTFAGATISAPGNSGVSGAGWQQLYVSVPATLTANICKIKSTYWVLTGYTNALPFVPIYVPSSTPVVTTCTPTQEWSWTVTGTPCTPCSCAGSAATCAEAGTDSCDFDYYDTYRYNTMTYSTGVGSTPATVSRVNTGYMAPTFNYVAGTTPVAGQTNGNPLYPYCAYDAGNRLDSVPNAINYRANCRVSGRGLSVDIAAMGVATCTQNAVVTRVQSNGVVAPAAPVASMVCPMANIAFVPNFPGSYQLTLNVFDNCGPPVQTPVQISAACRTKPTFTLTSPTISSFYYCADNAGAQGAWGSQNGAGTSGKFEPINIASLVTTSLTNPAVNVTAANAKSTTCTVAAPTATLNCSDARNAVNSMAGLVVDTSDVSGNKFRACCTCLYGTQTINVFGSGTNPTHQTPTPPPQSSTPASPFAPTTQGNNLALSDSEYNRNNIILIALVTPMAVLLVGSLAGNVLMVLKMRQGASSGGGFNVRAGDVELSTSPRSRVDV